LGDLHGSVPRGRVTRRAVSAAAAALASADVAQPVTQTVTQAAAQAPVDRVGSSTPAAVQATSVVEVDVTALLARGAPPSEASELLAPIAAAVVAGLRAVPEFNAAGADSGPHLAIRFDTTRGSLSPVVRNAADLNDDGLARRLTDLATRAQSAALTPEELTGATFSLANSSTPGLLLETPVVPTGQRAALTAGAVTERPVVLRHGDERVIAVRSLMYLALSYDPAGISADAAARFLTFVKARIESAPAVNGK
jgi:2-oxoglutarate dehydrogenase E2 component (dihydrolipoamide succinyltransferase)